MDYPNPAHAVSVWYDGEFYHVCTNPAPGNTKGTHTVTKSLQEIGEIARAQHGLRTKPEPRLTGALRDHTREIEFDLTGGRFRNKVRPEKELLEIANRAIASGAKINRHKGDKYLSAIDRERDHVHKEKQLEKLRAKAERKSATLPTISLDDLGL